MLKRGGGGRAGQLAKAADLTPASVTAMLDGLEQRGMVQRRRSEQDRRVVFVSLTPAGRGAGRAEADPLARLLERARSPTSTTATSPPPPT